MEVSNGLSEVITIQVDKFYEAKDGEFFRTGLYLGVAFLCGLLPLFFYFQYKQKIFILLDSFLVSLVLKFLFTYALIPGEFFELLGSISQSNFVVSIFYLINILQSLFLIYFVKLIINNKYIYLAALSNLIIYLIYILSSNILLEGILLNLFYINSYILILSIFIIYTQELKINVFMYLMGYGIQFFALYLLVIQWDFTDSPLDYGYYYFSILPIAYLIFFMYMLAHHYNLILNNKIYDQNQSNIKAAYQLELSKTVSNSQVLLLEAISHELKSPLMALYFLTDGLSSTGETLTRAKQRIKSTLNQISYIVERFSSLSKFYSISELDIKKNIDVQLLITSILEVRSDKEGINLQSNYDAKVESDYVLLQIIFQNLIENATKYRMDSESPINIDITHHKESLLRVDISNSLSQNVKIDLEKVFEMYYRGGNVKNEPGMGIGLWITKEIAKKIKGDIVAIRDDEKVIFRVSIPFSFPT
jgi:signal transduction histidine kinase